MHEPLLVERRNAGPSAQGQVPCPGLTDSNAVAAVLPRDADDVLPLKLLSRYLVPPPSGMGSSEDVLDLASTSALLQQQPLHHSGHAKLRT